MAIKVYMRPHPSQARGQVGGINRVVEAYGRYLPAFGVKVVDINDSTYDLRVGHAGSLGPQVDVETNHGLWWTADMPDVKPNHWTGNARVIQALRAAREVTVPSEWVKTNIARNMHISPTVIPHGVDWAEWQGGSSQGYVLWNKGRSKDVCDTTPVTKLANRMPGHRFVSTFCDQLLSNIDVIGRQDFPKMRNIIKGAGVYLATTKETMGIGTLEAMAAGIPVLGFDWGGTSDLVIHQETGYLARPGDYDALAEGLNYCTVFRDRLGAAAREAAKAYTWERACQMVAEVYRRALTPQYLPGVTIIIPSFSYGEVVGKAIQSALSQTLPPHQIIVVDDGSPDGGLTERAVKGFGDPKVLYVRQENMGVAYARNHGAALAQTELICFLDADDAIAPTFLEKLVPAMEADPLLGIAYSHLVLIHPESGEKTERGWPTECNFNQQVKGKNQVPTCCLIRAQAWKEIGGQRQRYAPQGCGTEDAEGWARIGSNGWRIKRVTDERLFLYTMGGRTWDKKAYTKVDWTVWHPWTRDGKHPFASIASPPKGLASHPVHQLDIPDVSVIIPIGPYHTSVVTDALDSLSAQTHREWEAIVVNDSGYELDLSPWPYLTVIDTPGGKGAGFARNRGIEISRAPHFVCLDADDFLQSPALERFLVAAGLYPGHWIYPDMYIYRGDGSLEHYQCQDFSVAELWRKGVGPVTAIYTREMWEKVGGFSETSYREDWDFHLRLAKAGYCGLRLTEPLLTYRHATGERRKDGSHRKEIVTLHNTYNQQELEMACKGCGKRGRARNLPAAPRQDLAPPRNWSAKEEENWPVLVYTGKNKSTLVFRGATRRRYYAGNNPSHKEVRVHPDDYEHLLRFRYFVPVAEGRQARPMTAVPRPKTGKPPKERQEEPVPFVLPDLSEARVVDILKEDFEELDITQLSDLIAQEKVNKGRVTVTRHLEKLKRRLKDG